MDAYKGTVELIGGLTPKNGGDFPLMAAKDIQVDDEGKRLDEKLQELSDGASGVIPVFEVDEVVTLEPGEKAYVDIDNANPATPLISFGIPKGEANVVTVPHIGENGNWFVGDEDTGVKAGCDCDTQTLAEMLDGFAQDPGSVKTYIDNAVAANAGGTGGSGGTGDIQTIEEMLEGFGGDPGSVKTYVDEGLAAKVDAVEGKGLSANDFTDEAKDKINNLQQNFEYISGALAGKVDAVEGKGLSTNDFTDTDKNNVDAVPVILSDVLDIEEMLNGFDGDPGSVKTYIDNGLAAKVDAIEGKGLSTNDLTDELRDQILINQEESQEIEKINQKLDGFADKQGSVKTYIDDAVSRKLEATVDGETLILS